MNTRRFTRVLLADLPVKVICLAAAVILLLLHRVTTLSDRFFSVPLDVTTPAGLAVASAFPKTVRITLRGASDAIFPILEEDITAAVDLTGHRGPGMYREEVRVERKGTAQGVEPLEIKVDPQAITFTLEPLAEKRVEVSADIKGTPAYGYTLVQSDLSPQNVVIRGARSRVQSISSLPTEVIDLTGRTSSFAARVKVLLPNALVKVGGEAAVDFHATIQEEVAQHQFDGVAVAAVDLPPHLGISTDLPSGQLKIQGTQLGIVAIRPEQLQLMVEMGGVRRAGTYTLPTHPAAVAGALILDWQPREVTVTVATRQEGVKQ